MVVNFLKSKYVFYFCFFTIFLKLLFCYKHVSSTLYRIVHCRHGRRKSSRYFSKSWYPLSNDNCTFCNDFQAIFYFRWICKLVLVSNPIFCITVLCFMSIIKSWILSFIFVLYSMSANIPICSVVYWNRDITQFQCLIIN